jgi:hypothetical protein
VPPFTPNRLSRPVGDRAYSSTRPYRPREAYVERNDPLPPKDPKEVKAKASFPELTFEQVFAAQCIGSITVFFQEADGEPIVAKNSHGYLTIKPRGQGPMTGYFRLMGAAAPLASLPEKKPFLKSLENSFKWPKDAKLTHVHYVPPKD